MSSKRGPSSQVVSIPISEFQYRQTVATTLEPLEAVIANGIDDNEVRITDESLRKSLAAERATAISETEGRLRNEYEQKSKAETQRINQALEHFEKTRKEYFARVESEVVQLALSIAAKILHREAQVDPMLVTALIQIALSQLKEGAAATIRVRPEELNRWRLNLEAQDMTTNVTVIEDASLQPKDCILETELGSVNLSLDVQLKEVEKGFFDVLAKRPTV